MKILTIIPARSGSKSIINKNIRLVDGKPLIAHSIEHALRSNLINRIIVSTDSKQYKNIAIKYGAEVPFLRPAEISGDKSTDLEVFQHALNWLDVNEDYMPEICIHLRPTHPVRDVQDIDNMIKLLIENKGIDSVRSIALAPFTPFKMWFRDESGLITPVVKIDDVESYNMPRQSLPTVYLQTASIDVVRSKVILKSNSMTGNKIYGYIINEFFDIDNIDDLYKVRKYVNQFKADKNE